jgi:hypothetical protein
MALIQTVEKLQFCHNKYEITIRFGVEMNSDLVDWLVG